MSGFEKQMTIIRKPFFFGISSLMVGFWNWNLPTVTAEDWPQFRGPTRDGISAEKNWQAVWPAEGPKQLWKTNVGIGSSGVAISKGRLFTTGWARANPKNDPLGTETVYCLDAETGRKIWELSYPSQSFAQDHEGGSAATPTVDGDRVYPLSRSGHLAGIEAATGKVVWAKELTTDLGGKPPFYGYTGSPLVLDNKIIVVAGGQGASTVALDKRTGATLWKTGNDAAAYATPSAFTLGGRAALAVFNYEGILALDAESGTERSRLGWISISPRHSSINATMPLVDGNRLLVTSSYGGGSALLNMTTNPPTILWRGMNFISHYSSPVLHNGYVYGFNTFNEWLGKGSLCCMKLDTGQILWSTPDPGWGSLIYSNNKLILLGRHGELIVAEATPAGYKEISRAHLLGSTARAEPVLSNNRLYVKNVAGDLLCLDLNPLTPQPR